MCVVSEISIVLVECQFCGCTNARRIVSNVAPKPLPCDYCGKKPAATYRGIGEQCNRRLFGRYGLKAAVRA